MESFSNTKHGFNAVYVVLARMDSSRFPGKMASPFLGRPLIAFLLERLLSLGKHRPILATTDRIVDAPLVEIAKEMNVEVFTGQLDDVRQRMLDSASSCGADLFARVNGDSPFCPVEHIDAGFHLMHENRSINFCSNLEPRRFPYGMSVELLRTDFYKEYINQMVKESDREHPTSYLYRNLARINGFMSLSALSEMPDLQHKRLVIDNYADHETLEAWSTSHGLSAHSKTKKILSLFDEDDALG